MQDGMQSGCRRLTSGFGRRKKKKKQRQSSDGHTEKYFPNYEFHQELGLIEKNDESDRMLLFVWMFNGRMQL